MGAFEKWKDKKFEFMPSMLEVGDLEDAFNAGFHHSRDNPKPAPGSNVIDNLLRTLRAIIGGV